MALLALAAYTASPPAQTQDGYLFQGIFDAELHDTDTRSPVLTRNDGEASALGRMQLWAAFQLSPALQLYAQGEVVTDDAEGYRETDTNLDQLALRYSRQSATWLFFEIGKILSPQAGYSERQLSTRNPLIARPLLYMQAYPWGGKVVGSGDRFDYQLAWIDPSRGDDDYRHINPDPAFRPAFSAGLTPFTGLRVGLSWTRGPYLNGKLGNYLPDGRSWRDYDQTVWGLDFQFSRGYLELSGQWLGTWYEVPFLDHDADGSSYFVELKYTWTPRLYTALRYQGVENTYVDYYGYGYHGYWGTNTNRFNVLEVGLGYRFNPDLLLKVSYQTDHWEEPGYGYARIDGGHALGLQLSWFFDVVSLLSDKL